MKRVVIYYIRHGKTEFNRDGIIQGGSVDSPLVAESMHLIEDTRRAFESLEIAHAWSSPLGRARKTAELVLAGHDTPIEPLETLREVDFGTLDGRSAAKLSNKLLFSLGYVTQNFTPWKGECAQDVRLRVRSAFTTMYHASEHGDSICAFAHGSLFRYVLQEFGTGPALGIRSRKVHTSNASVATLIASEQGIELVQLPTPGKDFVPVVLLNVQAVLHHKLAARHADKNVRTLPSAKSHSAP